MCGWYIDMRENSLMFGCSDDNNINYLNLAHEFHTKKNKITHATLSRVKNRPFTLDVRYSIFSYRLIDI